MLEVVEEAEHLLVLDLLGHAVRRADDLRCGRKDKLRVPHGSKRDPPNALRVAVRGETSGLYGESRLARPPRPGKCEQARVSRGKERRDLGELRFSSKKRCRRNWEVGPIQALEPRKLPFSEMVDALGRRQVLQAVLPRSLRSSSISCAVDEETRTCPPWPAAAMRAARCTSGPTYPSSARSGVPVCTPTRTWTLLSASASVSAYAAALAPGAVGKAKKNASPWVSTSTPPSRAQASRMTRRCSARAS